LDCGGAEVLAKTGGYMANWKPATYTVADCKVGMLIEAGVGGPEYPRGETPTVSSARRALGRSAYCGCEIRTYRDGWGDVRPLQCHHEDARQARLPLRR